MHVLVGAHDFYPDPGSGGTGRYVYETARRFVERGHRASVVTRRRGDVPRRESVEGIDVYRYDIEIADRRADEILPQVPAALGRVDEFVREASEKEPFDLLSFQGPVTSLLVHLCADDEVPRTATFHSPWPTEYRIRTREADESTARRELNAKVRTAVERFVLDRTRGVVTLSGFMRDRMRETYGEAARSEVVPGGVDVETFRPDSGEFERLTGAPSFLTVRRLSPRMGHDLLLEAFSRVVADRPDARLYIAGDGPLRDELERTAAELGVADETTFLGYVPDEALPSAYAAADLFVLPTTELEGFGLATLEALASGTPAVATPVGGTVELLSGLESNAGVPEPVLAEAAAPEALARRMMAWAELSTEARRSASRACRTYAEENYSWEVTVDSLEAVYSRWR
ncbi:glycosyltransferase family 4 protein [Haladaptatus salinisoli]|uniref:glycosyltransferase family 4 protein n=1 Tax=Haladaptatus salinisoli TaxID=2884876 RepID=UPI001D0B67A4|nr:glycosyltransferase family 4 protein [Haladaptatus salinisoli]